MTGLPAKPRRERTGFKEGASVRGILLIGLNGCGKTTLGRRLAERLGWFPMDAEDYYFRGADQDQPFAPRHTREDVERMLRADMEAHGDFVLSSVNPDWGAEILSRAVLAALLFAPVETRLARIEERARRRFGDRVLPGGDMYSREREFRAFAAGRDPREVERKAAKLACPVLRLDALRPLEENEARILRCLEAQGTI